MPNPKFDVFDKTLDLSGPRLIEASAGTGKTFSLVEIALRLLTEGEHPATIDRLLMVTFTNASTDELSQRLKERLEKEAVKGDGRILRALERFDDARIFTIHGFCHKMLSDCTFLHGGLYNVRLELEDAELIEQVADEFIRRGLRDATLSNADRLKLAGLKEKLQDVLKEFAAWDRPPEFRLFPDEGGPFEAYLKSFPAWGTARLKEINWKYVAEDICMAIIPTVLRKPDVGEQQQAVTTGVIIGWMASRTGMNREYTPQKVNAAMKKLQFKPKKTNKGNVYFVVRLLADDLKHAGELLANQEFKKEVEADIPF